MGFHIFDWLEHACHETIFAFKAAKQETEDQENSLFLFTELQILKKVLVFIVDMFQRNGQ